MNITEDRKVTYINEEEGAITIQAGAIILAMGCRERPRGALGLPGFRPAGVYTAGTAQRLINIEGYMVGKEVVILGSGDIGLIMARRMTLEGAKVKVVAELMPYSGGLKRNIVQCLDDYGIPLKLSHTVTKIHGKDRVTGVTISQVRPNLQPILGTEEFYTCDTLLLSCGLIPETELMKNAGINLNSVTSGPNVEDSLETSVQGVFACGNVLHVHDLVDFVSEEAARAGQNAVEFLKNPDARRDTVKTALKGENGVRYTVPEILDIKNMNPEVVVRFRVGDVYKNKSISVYYDDHKIRTIRKRVMAPGEMEQIMLNRDSFQEFAMVKEIRIAVED